MTVRFTFVYIFTSTRIMFTEHLKCLDVWFITFHNCRPCVDIFAQIKFVLQQALQLRKLNTFYEEIGEETTENNFIDHTALSNLLNIPLNDAQTGDGTILKQWLSNDGTFRYVDCCKLLQEAIIHGNLITATLLINSVDVRNVNQMSALLALACKHQHKDIVDWLLRTTTAQLDHVANGKKYSSSKICCENGNLEILKTLLSHYPTRLFGFDSPQCVTELGIASKKGHLNIVKFLVVVRDIDMLRIPWAKNHPLMQAVECGQLKITDWLINFYRKQATKIKNVAAILTDLLLCSSENGHWHITKYLCKRFTFNVNNTIASYVPYDGYKFLEPCLFNTPLHFVISIDVDEGLTPLHKAVIAGNIKMVSRCILSMTDTEINKQSNNGNTALHLACQREYEKLTIRIIQRLLVCADTTLTNDQKLTPCQLLKAKNPPNYWKTKLFDELFDRDKCYVISALLTNRWPHIIIAYLFKVILERNIMRPKASYMPITENQSESFGEIDNRVRLIMPSGRASTPIRRNLRHINILNPYLPLLR